MNPSDKGQEKPSLGAGGRKRKLHPLDSNKTECSASNSVENKDDECSDKTMNKDATKMMITESVALKPGTEDGDVVGANKSQSSACDSFWSDATATSFHDLLRIQISKLCEVLGLSEDVKATVERFLEYVIEKYQVNNEDANTLQAFLISLSWRGSELLEHKLDRTQSVSLANEHLNFSCNEEETCQIYLKLESAKEMFIRYTENQKKTYVSEDSIPETEPTSTQLLEVNDVQVNSPSSAETSCLQTIGTGKVNQLNAEGSSLQLGMGQCSPSAEIQSAITSDEQRSDSYSADKVDCQPSDKPPSPSENLSASSQVLEAITPHGSNLLSVQRHDNRNQGVSRPYSDPLQCELENLCELKNNISKFHEVVKLRLKSDHEKELAEVIAEMNRKYEAKCQDAEAAFQLKRAEIDISFKKVVKNKMLPDAYRSKCRDMIPFDPAVLRVPSGGLRFQGQPSSMGRSVSLSPTRPPHSPSIPSSTQTRPQAPNTPKESQASSIFDFPKAADGPMDGSSIPSLGSFSDTSSLFPDLSMFVNGPKYRGVKQSSSGKWEANISLPKARSLYLGTFRTAEEAAFAFDTAAYWLKGDNAHLNFPDMKNELKANATNTKIAALLEAKMQAVSKEVTNTSKTYRGVRHISSEKWAAVISLPKGRKVYLGTFRTAEEAAFAFDTAAYMLRGENAHLNFPHMKDKLKANSTSLSGSIVALLKANMQTVSKQVKANTSKKTKKTNDVKLSKTRPSSTTGPMNTDGSSIPKLRGVRQKPSGKWIAEITIPISKRWVQLGTFLTPEEASFAYDTAAYWLKGDNAHLNFPDMKSELKANATNTNIAAFLEAKMQSVPKDVANTKKKASDVELSESPTIGGGGIEMNAGSSA